MAKKQRKIPSQHDYITHLPQSLIEIILTKLSLRDAVRTSILSLKWRFKWATLTHLEFNDKCVSKTLDRSLANFINRFLLLHEGPIYKFVISSDYLHSSPDVDQWLLFLSRKDVTELVLNFGQGYWWYKAPFCLFACQKLVSLELHKLTLIPPLSFKEFPVLKQLNFQEVNIASNALENLISSCPLLESLNLSYYEPLELTIRAPNLKYLILEGNIEYICLENTPKLVAITAYILAERPDQSSSCKFDKFFGGVPSLQKLIGINCFMQYMSGGIAFCKTEMTYLQLKVIELSHINFDIMNEIKVVFRLISNAPNLQQLQISSLYDETEPSDLDFWEKECLFDCTFGRLKIVKMMDMCGSPHEVKFIGFILGNSPALETISIASSVHIEDKLSFLTELTKFPRASTKAEMIFVQN